MFIANQQHFSRNEEWHAEKGIVIVYSPSPVKSPKFLPAVNHTKLRIPMFTPELMEKSTCNLVWKTKVCQLGLLFFPWIWMLFKETQDFVSIATLKWLGCSSSDITHRLKASGWGCCGVNSVCQFFSDFCNKVLPFELLVFLQQISMVKFNLYTLRTMFTCWLKRA